MEIFLGVKACSRASLHGLFAVPYSVILLSVWYQLRQSLRADTNRATFCGSSHFRKPKRHTVAFVEAMAIIVDGVSFQQSICSTWGFTILNSLWMFRPPITMATNNMVMTS